MVSSLQNSSNSTSGGEYTNRLVKLETTWWKQLLDVQAPYRWNLRRLHLGFTLEVGCGVGRNLKNLLRSDGTHGAVGVDHNKTSIEVARERGLAAFTAEEFLKSPYAKPGQFDSLLLAHVVEHMAIRECADLITDYRKYLKPGSRLILITPQEAGFRSDSTHVEFMDFEKLSKLQNMVGTNPISQFSFPFPRQVGKVFKYNEFVSVSAF